MTDNKTAKQAKRGRSTKIGVVASAQMNKSVIVRVARTVKHKRYKRYIRRTARFMAHDEHGACKLGDTVEIVESRPLSARKRWRVSRVVRSTAGSVTDTPKAAE